MAGSVQKLKFPILKDIEFFDVIKNKQTLKTFNKKDCEGLKWRDMQLKIGQSLPAGLYHYNMKINNDDSFYKGTIRVISTMQPEKTNDNSAALNEIEAIKKQLSTISNSNGVSVDLLISITKQSYETQINFLNAELQRKENLITKLENQIDSLNDELDNASDQIEELKSKTGLNQYIEIANTFLQSKIGTAKKITTLKDSNPDDIPARILELLGAVDWSKVPDNELSEIIRYLEIFLTKLPLKG